jgi:hypothetical protein
MFHGRSEVGGHAPIQPQSPCEGKAALTCRPARARETLDSAVGFAYCQPVRRPLPMRRLLHVLHRRIPSPIKRAFLRSHLSRSLPAGAWLRLAHEPGPPGEEHHLGFERHGEMLTVRLNLERLDRDSHALNPVWKRLPVMLHFLARTAPTVRRAGINLSDGADSRDRELAFCSHNPRALLVPDRGFMTARYYRPLRELALAGPEHWSTRADTVLWRGGANGAGLIFNDSMSPADSDLMQRVRLCLLLKDVPGTDARITGAGRDENRDEAARALARHGLAGGHLPAAHWATVKFALDVDGQTNAWSNFYTRLLLGCCVLKVASPLGYKQWYYDELAPWKHFVPVAADLSNLRERIAWCRANDDAARHIAAAGREFTLRRTPASETVLVTERLNRALAEPGAGG